MQPIINLTEEQLQAELKKIPDEYQTIFQETIEREIQEGGHNDTDADRLTYLRRRQDDMQKGAYIRPDGKSALITATDPDDLYSGGGVDGLAADSDEAERQALRRQNLLKISGIVVVALAFVLFITLSARSRAQAQSPAEEETTAVPDVVTAAAVTEATATPAATLPELAAAGSSLETIGSLGAALQLGRPGAIELHFRQSEEVVALAVDPARVSPQGELPFNEEAMTSDQPLAVWVHGAVLNYAMGIPDALAQNLHSGDRIILSTDTGHTLQFVVTETFTGNVYDSARYLSQDRSGMTLFSLPAPAENEVRFALANYDTASEDEQTFSQPLLGEQFQLTPDIQMVAVEVTTRHNPDGLFNVTFAIGHCASQDPDRSGGMYTSTPAYDMSRKHHADEAMFAIVNGDVIYEERRDGTLNGIRDNYKLYFSRGRSFASLFRSTPALFTFDDHDIGWDIHGCGQIGLGDGLHLIRDLGLRGYEEYLSWANYRGPQSGRVRFGKGTVTAGSDVLVDPNADFTDLDPATVSTIHLGNYTRGENFGRRRNAPKNAGVYGLTQVVDAHRLQINPPAKADETLSYSIGTHHYYDWKIANCHFFALDTRGERSNRNPKDRSDPRLFILGPAQEKWFVEGVQNTDADFIFVISPDPWVIYHTAAHVGGDDKDDKGDGFPSFLHQRERLIKLLDAVKKPVLIFTGDVHASASVKITDNVFEMMCGPLGSTGHPLGTLGYPPPRPH